MSTPDMQPPGTQGFRSYLPEWLLAPRRGRYVRQAGKLTPAGRERDVAAIQRARPGTTRQQALRESASLRRRGYLPAAIRSDRLTAEDWEAAGQYERRREAAQRAAETRRFERTRSGPGRELSDLHVRVITFRDIPETGERETATLDVPATQLSSRDRSEAARHRNVVFAYLNNFGDGKYREVLASFAGKGVTVRREFVPFPTRPGDKFVPFEYDVNRIMEWANRLGSAFTPEDFYTEVIAA
jgi:hypothetical protein